MRSRIGAKVAWHMVRFKSLECAVRWTWSAVVGVLRHDVDAKVSLVSVGRFAALRDQKKDEMSLMLPPSTRRSSASQKIMIVGTGDLEFSCKR